MQLASDRMCCSDATTQSSLTLCVMAGYVGELARVADPGVERERE